MTASGARYTFRANRARGRHGWLRLTPAYSLHTVEEILAGIAEPGHVLDPFCGTGTTALVCVERGIPATTLDINPFLVWFARAKTDVYGEDDQLAAAEFAAGWRPDAGGHWLPAIADIERWWSAATLDDLGSLRQAIAETAVSDRARTLLMIALCRVVIALSSASFRHQSMSFRRSEARIPTDHSADTAALFRAHLREVTDSAGGVPPRVRPEVLLGDARRLSPPIPPSARFQTVITSPPYPNRMSYIRELRPYMYWLGFLESGSAAGALDWQAIGGTWGSATSNLTRWRPSEALGPGLSFMEPVLARIDERGPVLARYVERYVHDMRAHLGSLMPLLDRRARVVYVVGNSRFYDTMVETERIFAALFAERGLSEIDIRPIRKRTSKRELVEYVVSARAPA